MEFVKLSDTWSLLQAGTVLLRQPRGCIASECDPGRVVASLATMARVGERWAESSTRTQLVDLCGSNRFASSKGAMPRGHGEERCLSSFRQHTGAQVLTARISDACQVCAAPRTSTVSEEIALLVGGDAGQGVESIAFGFCKALARAGHHVFTAPDYRSRIRGGHNFHRIRVARRPVFAQRAPFDLLVAMTPETIDVHLGQLAPGAGILYDESLRLDDRIRYRADSEEVRARDLRLMPLPLVKIAADHGSRVMMSTAMLGALAGITGLRPASISEVIRDIFAGKSAATVDANLAVVAAAYRLAQDRYGDFPATVVHEDGHRRILAYDGRPFSPQEILAAVERAVAGEREVHIVPGEPPLPRETDVGVNV